MSWIGIYPVSGAQNPELATFMYLCHGVFTDQFILRTILARNSQQKLQT